MLDPQQGGSTRRRSCPPPCGLLLDLTMACAPTLLLRRAALVKPCGSDHFAQQMCSDPNCLEPNHAISGAGCLGVLRRSRRSPRGGRGTRSRTPRQPAPRAHQLAPALCCFRSSPIDLPPNWNLLGKHVMEVPFRLTPAQQKPAGPGPRTSAHPRRRWGRQTHRVPRLPRCCASTAPSRPGR